MAYDIPPPLEHKERIMFGLTFSQLGYAFPSFLVVFYIIFRTNLPLPVSGTLSVLICCLASIFMFFEGASKVRHWYNFIKNPEMEVLSCKLKEIIDIRKVEGNKVHLSKSRTAILEVIPMNFMLKTEEEKQGIIIGFQKFLNSLDFHVQVHITSDEISLAGHFRHFDRKGRERGCDKKLIDSYCDFIRETIKENGIRNRRFFVIIKEKDDLETQANVCSEKLKSIGLKVKGLDDRELSKFLFSYIAGKKQKEAKGDEVKDVAHFLYSPEKVTFSHDSFQALGKFCNVVGVTGYPSSVEVGFLDRIISSGEDYDISIHIEPFPIDVTMVRLNRDLQKQQADLYSDSKRGIISPSLEIKYNSTRKVLEDLQKGRQKLFNVSLYIMCRGKNKEGIRLLSRKVKAELDSLMMQSTIPSFRMADSYASMLPLANDRLGMERNIHTEGLAAFFPFSSPFLDMDREGAFLGLNKNNIPLVRDIFSLANANGIVLATSGAGKSYFTKLFLSRQFMNGSDVIIIDPQGEYLAITQHYNGECITISKDSDTIINPLDLCGHSYLEKRLSLLDLFYLMFEGDLNGLQKSMLDHAIDLTYGNRGITRDDYENHKPPTMGELFKMLGKLERDAIKQERVTYRALMNRIQMFTEKGVFGFLDRHTNINFSSNFVCFNIGAMPKQVKPVIMYLVLDYVYMRMKDSKGKKILVVDEAWSMLQTAEESSYVYEIVKTCRKYNLGLLMITQDVSDLLGSKAGHAVLANTSYTFLLRQKPAVILNVAKSFNLSQAEKDFLVSAELGEGILIMENDHQELRVVSSPEEHKLVTTNPEEVIKLDKPIVEEDNKEDETADLDLNRIVYPVKGLTPLQVNFLNNQGYVLKKGHGLKSGPHSYYVKEKHPESLEHTLLVGLIYEEIRKYTEELWVKQTKEPDIVFINKAGKKIALEIETGFGIKKHRARIDEKFNKFRQSYGKRGYIVLTSMTIINSYAKYGFTMLNRNQIRSFVKLQFKSGKNGI